MPTYNFRKDSKVYVVRGGLRYVLDVYPDLTFSQTFNETNVPVKTLHSQYDMFEGAVITKANPANFTMTIPVLDESDMDVLISLLVNYDNTSTEATINSADLYVENNSEVYKLEMAVIETGTFTIARDSIIVLSLSGSARKLSKHVGAIPGTLQARSSTRTYAIPTRVEVMLGATTLTNVAGLSIELSNDVQWVDFATLQNSLVINGASETMFPEVFVVGSRTLSGNIQQYITDETNTTVQSWSTSTSLSIKAGNLGSGWALEFALPSVVYTNRLDPQEVYIQSFDFRMNANPTDLSLVIIKN